MKPAGEKDAIPNGWKQIRLGEVLKLEYGVSLPDRKRLPGNVPVIGSAGAVGHHNQATNNGPGLVIGRKGSIGSVTWVAEDFVPIDTTYFAVPVDCKADLRWTYHFLARENLSKLNRATGIPGLNRDDVYALSCIIPPLPEQRAIATVLDSIDDAIEGAEAVIAATESLRDALLHDLLTRGLPGQHTEWRDIPGLGTIPADWEVVRLGDVAETITSGSRAWSRHFRTDGALFVRSQNIVKGRIDRSDPVFVEAPNDKEAERTRIREGDILVSITGEPGKATVADEYIGEAYVSQHVAMVRLREHQFSQYVCRSLQSSFGQEQFSRMAYGQTRPGLNLSDIGDANVALAPLAEQQAIAAVLDGVDATVEQAWEERDPLRLLKESTADALLTGRVRIGQ